MWIKKLNGVLINTDYFCEIYVVATGNDWIYQVVARADDKFNEFFSIESVDAEEICKFLVTEIYDTISRHEPTFDIQKFIDKHVSSSNKRKD